MARYRFTADEIVEADSMDDALYLIYERLQEAYKHHGMYDTAAPDFKKYELPNTKLELLPADEEKADAEQLSLDL